MRRPVISISSQRRSVRYCGSRGALSGAAVAAVGGVLPGASEALAAGGSCAGVACCTTGSPAAPANRAIRMSLSTLSSGWLTSFAWPAGGFTDFGPLASGRRRALIEIACRAVRARWPGSWLHLGCAWCSAAGGDWSSRRGPCGNARAPAAPQLARFARRAFQARRSAEPVRQSRPWPATTLQIADQSPHSPDYMGSS